MQPHVVPQAEPSFQQVPLEEVASREVGEHFLPPGRRCRLRDLLEQHPRRPAIGPFVQRHDPKGHRLSAGQRSHPFVVQPVEGALIGVAQPRRDVILGGRQFALHHPSVTPGARKPGAHPIIAILALEVQPIDQQHGVAARCEHRRDLLHQPPADLVAHVTGVAVGVAPAGADHERRVTHDQVELLTPDRVQQVALSSVDRHPRQRCGQLGVGDRAWIPVRGHHGCGVVLGQQRLDTGARAEVQDPADDGPWGR